MKTYQTDMSLFLEKRRQPSENQGRLTDIINDIQSRSSNKQEEIAVIRAPP